MTIATTTSLVNWISPTTVRALAWALLHFLWQGTALAALAAVLLSMSRRSQVRYLIGVAVLALMFLAPLTTFLLSSQQPANARGLQPAAGGVWLSLNASLQATQAIPSSSVITSRDALLWLVEAWLVGVAFFSLRYAGGFLLIERERRKKSAVVDHRVLEICYAIQDQLGLRRAIQYCEGVWLQAPAVIGWFRPIVFLPASALTGLSEEQLQSVIAHELAHIQRFDPFVNVFQVCVESLLFYHPAVWWLNKRIRAEREVCCDETAVSLCGNAVDYARALTLMEEWRSAPVLAMAANRGPLTERILRVLGLKTFGSGMRGIGLAGSSLCLVAALLAGNALLGIAHPKAALAAALFQAAPKASSTASQPASAPSPKPSAARPQSSEPASATSYIDGMKAAGLGDLTVDQLVALKIQDVTPEYVRGLREQGMHVDADSLIGMRVQGVTPEYIRELHSAGLNPDQNQIIALKVQDVDAQYYRALKEAGIDPDVNKLIALKVQDVTPEYVRALRADGMATTADEVIAMKVQDVTPAYAKELRALGLQISGNDLIAMKVQDVTPEWVKGIQALGLKPTTNELIGMRVQDVTPEYIKALQSAGFKVGVNEIIGAKVQDVTPEFIDQVKQHGFKDLTLDKVIRLRQLGILDSKADL